MSDPVISQDAFFALAEVKRQQELQKTAGRFGDKQHRDATIAIRELAAGYGAERYFETIEEYDKVNKELGL